MNWYYAKNGAQEGPVTTEALRAKIDSGEVAPTDLAWREGLADWLPVSRIPEFSRQELPPAVPGIPAAPPIGQTATPYTPPVAPATPSYQQPYHPGGALPPASPSSGMAIGSLICGILGLLICCAPYIQIPLALVAIILGHVAASKAKKDPSRYGGRGMGITGSILGYIALLIGLIFGFYTLKILNDTKNMTDAQKEEYIGSGNWLPLPESSREQYRRQFQEQMKAQREKQQQLQNTPKESP